MDSKLLPLVNKIKSLKHKERYIVIACVLGVALILLSELVPSGSTKKTDDGVDYQEYIVSLE